MHSRVGTPAINRAAPGKLVHLVPYTGGVPGDFMSAAFSATHAAFFVLLCWALCVAHLFVPMEISNLT